MITITPSAAAQIRAATDQAGVDGLALRIAARQDGEGGIEYGMGFDEARDTDTQLECAGVDVLVGAASHGLLTGTTLDFVEFEPGDFRFIFIPPCTAAPQAGACSSGACGGCRSR